MTRALVTGASGFIGGHLADALVARGFAVRALVRPKSNTRHLEALGVERVQGDVVEPESLATAVAGADYVFHLAARTHAIHRSTLMRVNGGGTLAVAAACAASRKPPVLVVVSSIAAAGPVERGRIRDENQPAHPVSAYGQSKRDGELAAERWADRVPTTIVRPGIVFGPRDRELLRAFRMIRRFRVHLVPGTAPPPLSFVYVESLVEVLIRAAERGTRLDPAEDDPARGYYFACAPEHPDYRELGRMLADAIPCRTALMLPLPRPVVWVLAGGNQCMNRLIGRSDLFCLDKIREALVPSWACSGRRAESELGLPPARPLDETLRTTAEWYRRERWL